MPAGDKAQQGPAGAVSGRLSGQQLGDAASTKAASRVLRKIRYALTEEYHPDLLS